MGQIQTKTEYHFHDEHPSQLLQHEDTVSGNAEVNFTNNKHLYDLKERVEK